MQRPLEAKPPAAVGGPPGLEGGQESSSKAHMVSDQSERRALTQERELREPLRPN